MYSLMSNNDTRVRVYKICQRRENIYVSLKLNIFRTNTFCLVDKYYKYNNFMPDFMLKQVKSHAAVKSCFSYFYFVSIFLLRASTMCKPTNLRNKWHT